ncbi:DinB family protein [Streptomyces durbertensis]|uniref:DinB family protein n=1 Tax=Streptomyces durbertensis TaxID=2448886 RepID=A0ABR6ERJ4_9ACTN|nr:DinB family protein [Streptomyces durbertensis]MBB1247169.1 DinB family protein [Streptomyces durbertensis]
MTTPPEVHGDERGALLGALASQREAFRQAVEGLTEEQARSTPSASELSLAGLIKHVTSGETGWIDSMRSGSTPGSDDEAAVKEWQESFVPTEEETVAVLLERYGRVAAETEKAVREVPSLDDTFMLADAPWQKGGPRSWRWGLLHLIEEAARHAGHADVIRETIDGHKAMG